VSWLLPHAPVLHWPARRCSRLRCWASKAWRLRGLPTERDVYYRAGSELGNPSENDLHANAPRLNPQLSEGDRDAIAELRGRQALVRSTSVRPVFYVRGFFHQPTGCTWFARNLSAAIRILREFPDHPKLVSRGVNRNVLARRERTQSIDRFLNSPDSGAPPWFSSARLVSSVSRTITEYPLCPPGRDRPGW
jgi:hypothetical protein